MKTALITGATAGIGEACAHIFAQHNYQLIITGRRKKRLEKLENKLEKQYNVKVKALCFDVREKKEVSKALNGLSKKWQKIDVLVNNAGLAAGLEPIDEGNVDNWERMIDTNVKGLLYVTRVVSPWMREAKTGHIVNIASIAGKQVYANGNVYCASKHAADALSQGMRLDLVKHNIKVTNIAPGLVETEFSLVRFDGDDQKAAQTYNGMTPLTGKDIAESVWFAVNQPKHVQIADMLILPAAQADATTVIRG